MTTNARDLIAHNLGQLIVSNAELTEKASRLAQENENLRKQLAEALALAKAAATEKERIVDRSANSRQEGPPDRVGEPRPCSIS